MTPQQKYYRKNRERLLKKSREKYHENIEQEHERTKKYKQDNKELIKTRRNERARQKRKKDPSFKIRSNVSRSIRDGLKRDGGSKGGLSFLQFIGYSIFALKNHLESNFEPWMNWNNYGVFNLKKWDDQDRSTWTWQIDHIIPQSEIIYSSMKDDNFKKCWSLSNLRPLSAKQNFLNGIDLLRKK
jgi:hypothetical protein